MDKNRPPKKTGWKIAVQHWELDGVPVSILNNRLTQEFGQPSAKSDTVQQWNYSPDSFWNREIRVDVDRVTGEIEVAGYGSELGKRLCQALILVAPILLAPFILYSAPVLEWWAQFLPLLPLNVEKYTLLLPYLASIIYLAPMGANDRHDEALIETSLKTREKSSNYLYIISSLAILFYWTSLKTGLPEPVANGLLLAVFVLYLLLSYRGETSQSLQAQIPIVSLLWFIWPLFILVPPILMGEPLGTTTSQTLTIQIAATTIVTVGIFLTFAGLFGLLRITNTLYISIQTSKIKPYHSKIPKYTITVLYTAANLIMLAGITLTLSIIYYTTSEEYLFPEPLLTRLGLTEPIKAGITLLNTLFQSFPGTYPRIYTLFFELVILTPLIIITGMWLHSLINEASVKYQVLKHSETLKNPEQNIEIRVTPTGPPIQTMTLLLGTKQYIIVNEKLVERTEDKELDALITHEAYHLQNRDLLINTFAALTGLLFGGKNAVLALYDYPKKEREADKKAVNETSSEKLIDGIYQIYDLLSEQNHHPGTQNPRQLNKEDENMLESMINTPKRIIHQLMRAYAVFFGDVLLSKAHLSKEDRIQYIKQLDESRQSDRR